MEISKIINKTKNNNNDNVSRNTNSLKIETINLGVIVDNVKNKLFDKKSDLNKDLNEYRKYLTKEEYNNLEKQDEMIKNNIKNIKLDIEKVNANKDKAINILNEYNSRYGELRNGANELYNENKNALDERLKSGRISKEEYDKKLKKIIDIKDQSYELADKYFIEIIKNNPNMAIEGLNNYNDYKKYINEQKELANDMQKMLYNYEQISKILPDTFVMQSENFKNSNLSIPYNLNITYEELMSINTLVNDANERDSAGEMNAFDNLKKKYKISSIKDFNTMKELYFMDNDSQKLYQYYINKGDNEKAEQFIKSMQDEINNSKGLIEASQFLKYLENGSIGFVDGELQIYDKAITNTLKTFGYGTGDGVLNFFEGLENIIYPDGVRSESDYRRMYIMKGLSENEEWKHYLPTTYEFSSSLGNMIPSMAVSAIISYAGLPAAGAKVASSLMGISAAGNTTEESLQEGHDLASSYLYGSLIGISESTLGYFLGKTPLISEKSGLTLANLWSETLEEGSQEVIASMLQNIIFKEQINGDELLKNTTKSAIMGFSMALFLNGGQSIITNIAGKNYNIKASTLEEMLNQMGENYTPQELLNYIQNNCEITNNSQQINNTNDVSSSFEIINVMDIGFDEQKGVIIQEYNPRNLYKGYDYIIKPNNNLSNVITELSNNEILGKIVLDLENTKGLTREMITKLPDNVDIRVSGGYTENWLQHTYKRGSAEISAGKNVTYTKEQMMNIIEKIENFENGVNPNWNDYEKARYTYEYLKNNIKYNPDPGGTAARGQEHESLMSLIVGESTCQGFAHTYKELLDRLGIKCVAIGGTYKNFNNKKRPHAYNIVEIDGKTMIVDTVRESFANEPLNGFDIYDIDRYTARNNEEMYIKAALEKYDENGKLKVFNRIKENLLHTEQEKINLGDNTKALDFFVETLEEISKKSNNAALKIVQNFDVISKINPGFKIFESTKSGNGFMKNVNALVINLNESMDFYAESHEIGHVILKIMDNTTVPNNFDNVIENMKNNTKSIDNQPLKIGEDIIEEPTFGKILLAIADPKNVNVEGIASLSDIISSAFQTIGWENVRGQRVILPYNHPKEYYTTVDSEGVVIPKLDTIYDEQFANFFALYSNNNTEMLNVLKNLFGDEWYNLMESKVNEIANSMEKVNNN